MFDDPKAPTKYTVLQSEKVTVLPGENVVSLPFEKLSENKSFGVLLQAPEGVFWRSRRPTNDCMHHFTVKNGKLSAETDGCELSFSNKVDLPADAAPQNVINGISRTLNGALNAWVSDRALGLPQSLTLTLKDQATISLVQITAGVDLCYPRYAFHYVPLADKTVKCLTVEVHNKDGWHKVGEVRENFRRMMRVQFPPIAADAVKITVTDTLGVNYAKIYEVRIYK